MGSIITANSTVEVTAGCVTMPVKLSDVVQIAGASLGDISNIVVLTQSQYNALEGKDSTTLYLVTG